MTEQQNSEGEPSKGEGRGSKAELRLSAADIHSPLRVRLIERQEDTVVVENRRGERVTIHPSVLTDNNLELGEEELLLPEGVYRHYFGRRAARLSEAQEREGHVLMRGHFSLLLSFQGQIIESPWLSACYSPAWRIGGIPVGGADYLSLGVLERLWRDGTLLMECPACGETAHIYYLIGSYLSGRNHAHGYCRSCERFVCCPSPGGRSLGQFRHAINEVSRTVYLGGGLSVRRASEGKTPRLLFPKELEPPERGCPSLRMVIEELA